jgi:hypothetical protein
MRTPHRGKGRFDHRLAPTHTPKAVASAPSANHFTRSHSVEAGKAAGGADALSPARMGAGAADGWATVSAGKGV